MTDEIMNELLALLLRVSLQDLYGRAKHLNLNVAMDDFLIFTVKSDEVIIKITETAGGIQVFGKIDTSLIPFRQTFKVGTVYDLTKLEDYLEHELTAIV